MALVTHEFTPLVNEEKEQFCEDFAIDFVRTLSQPIIELVSRGLNAPMTVAAQVLGYYLGIRADYAFEVFPVTNNTPHQWQSQTDVSMVPKILVVDGDNFKLVHQGLHYDYTGYVEQSICRYRSSSGKVFHLLAVRTGVKNFYDNAMPYLTIGREAASAYLLGRVDIERSNDATVILALDLEVSLELRALVEGSRHVNKSNVIVSGLMGGTAALKSTELTQLTNRRIVIVPEFHREGLLAVEAAVALCQKVGAEKVRVYPWPLYASAPESATTAWAEEFLTHASNLAEVDSPACLLRKINRESLTALEFQALLEKLRVIVQEPTLLPSSSTQGFVVKRLNDLTSSVQSGQSCAASLDRMFSLRQITLLWGNSNSGKSLIVMTLALALASGTQAFAIANQSDPRRVLLIDGELTDKALAQRAQQLIKSQADQAGINERLFTISTREHVAGFESVLQQDFAKQICDVVKESQIQVVILDNLISLASSATRGNDDALFELIHRIEEAGAAVILVHHSTKGGEAFKGSSNLASKSQNIIHIEGRDALQEDEHCWDAVKVALHTDGAVVRLNWTKCKTAPMLEGSSSYFALPLGGTWLPITKIMDTGCASTLSEEATPKDGVATLSADEQKAFALFSDRQQHTRKAVEASLRCGEDKAGNVLTQLKTKELIKKVGGGRNTAYTLA